MFRELPAFIREQVRVFGPETWQSVAFALWCWELILIRNLAAVFHKCWVCGSTFGARVLNFEMTLKTLLVYKHVNRSGTDIRLLELTTVVVVNLACQTRNMVIIKRMDPLLFIFIPVLTPLMGVDNNPTSEIGPFVDDGEEPFWVIFSFAWYIYATSTSPV